MRAPTKLYRFLLTAYPRSFRRRYGDMAVADFGSLYVDTLSQEGRPAALLLGLRTILNVVRDGLRERTAGLRHGPPQRGLGNNRPSDRGPSWSVWLAQLTQDLRYGVRGLARAPGFTAVAVFTLALGMAANATIFGMVYALMFSELPYGDYHRLAVIWTTYPDRGAAYNASSIPDWADWRARSDTFEDIAFHNIWEANLTGGDEPVGLRGYLTTANVFDVLRVEPLLGRGFVEEDGKPGADAVVVLGWQLWQRLGGDPELLGDSLVIDDREHTVVGIMPQGFDYPMLQRRGDLWKPIQFTTEDLTETRRHRHVVPIGRLVKGATPTDASTELEAIMGQLAEEHEISNGGTSARAVALRHQMSEPMRPALGVLLATIAFVLLICCANVANLLLAKASSRRAEIAVRMSLGASRARVVRQLLTESALVALIGGAIGVVLSHIAGASLTASLPTFVAETIPSSAIEAGAEPRVMAATFALAALTSLVFGLAPALRAARPDLQGALRAGSGAARDAVSRSRLRGMLVVCEVAVSVVLVAGAGLMVKGFAGLLQTDPGFEPAGVLTAELALSGPRYDDPEPRRAFYADAIAAIRMLPGVTEAGASTILPLTFGNNRTAFVAEGVPDNYVSTGFRQVTPGYLEAMHAELVAGRLIEKTDDASAPLVIVVNEALLQYLPEGNPIGMRIREAGSDEWMTIVGIVKSFRHSSLLQPPDQAFFAPYEQADSWRRMYVTIRGEGPDPAALAASVRQAVWTVDPTIPVDDVRTLREIVDTSLFVVQLPTRLMAVFGATALLLAAVGLYGVLAYLVAQRSREVGIRVALGARRTDVLRLVMTRGLLLALIGIGVGVALAIPVGRILASVLEGIDANEPLIYFGVPGVLILVTLLASYVPALRALAVDPVVSLRSD